MEAGWQKRFLFLQFRGGFIKLLTQLRSLTIGFSRALTIFKVSGGGAFSMVQYLKKGLFYFLGWRLLSWTDSTLPPKTNLPIVTHFFLTLNTKCAPSTNICDV